MDLCANDDSFGPGSDCRTLDFTIKFEQSILSILPNAVFTLLVALRVNFLRRKASRLERPFDFLLALKVVFGLLFAGGSAATLAKIRDVAGLPGIATPAAAIQLVASIFFLALSVSEHYKSIAPSTLATSYALSLGLFGATELRTLAAVGLQSSSAFVPKAVVVSAIFALLMLETAQKRTNLQQKYLNLPRATTTSFVIKPLFFHLFPLLYTGYKRRLTLDDLGDVPRHLLAVPARERLKRGLEKEDQARGTYLFRASIRAFGGSFGGPVIPRLILMLATFGQVFLVQDMTGFVADPTIPSERGYALVGGFAIIYTLIALSTYLYWEKVFNMTVAYRSALVGSIYMKTLRLSSVAAREVGQGAATTYMSVDAERITGTLEYFHEMWAAVLSIGIACALLWFQAKWAMFAPLFIIVLFLGITSSLSGAVGKSQTNWMGAIDQRIKLLTSVFSQLLPIKLGAYEKPLMAKISELRDKETQQLRGFYVLITITSGLSNMGSTFSGLACIGAYAIMLSTGATTEPLDVSRIFTILTIVNLLNGPINMIGQVLPEMLAGYASLKRIQSFLILAEKAEPARRLSADETALDTSDPIDPKGKLALEDLPTLFKVVVKDGSFGWDDKTAVLEGINLELTPGELHMVVGSVASGKSTLLLSLLGESVQLKGSLDVQARKIALATQTPFIYPGTFRSNVLLDQEYDQDTFDRVIHACGLRQDLDKLPKGEHSMLGERGVSLSGGQRQRLSLARAVYANADLILLDDTFSALDGETEAHVFASLFGSEGVLKGKTIVLVTHGIQHLPSADKVIVMDSGRISHFGSFEQVRDAGAAFALAAKAGTSSAIVAQTTGPKASDEMVVTEEEDEELLWENSQNSRWGAYVFFFHATGALFTILVFALLLCYGLVKAGLQGFLKEFSTSTGHLAEWMIGYTAFSLAAAAAYILLLGVFIIAVTQKAAKSIHRQELAGIMASPPSYFQKTPAGKILNRFSQDIQEADFGFPLGVLGLGSALLGLLSTLIFLVIATPWLGLAIPILAPVYFFVMRFYLSTSKQLQRLESGSKSPLYTLFSTTVGGLTSIRAFRATKFFEEKNNGFLDHSQGPFFFRFSGMLFLRVTLSWMTAILAIGLSIIAVALRNSTSSALLGVALSQLTSLGQQLMQTLMAYAMVENSVVALERIQEFVDLPPEDPDPLPYDRSEKAGILWPSSGKLEFVNIKMRYRDDLPPALNDVSFSLEGGMKIGICGRTGSGKSSSLLALFRAIDAHLFEGKVLIDGVDTASVPLEMLRDSMSIVTQDPFLWHGSVRENLDIEGHCSDEAIWRALKSVGMDEVVTLLPEKLESLVVDEESFSKGQRQLLCLARALLRKKKIVVLDESTSSMDHLTDEKIRQVVDSELAGSTVLAIAHRISSIVNFDRILLLDNGSVLEFDTPQNLLSNPDSRFARLAATQGIYADGSGMLHDEGESKEIEIKEAT